MNHVRNTPGVIPKFSVATQFKAVLNVSKILQLELKPIGSVYHNSIYHGGRTQGGVDPEF